MSGLCGIVPAKSDRVRDVSALDRGLGAIAHRGPDGISCYHDEHILIGHVLFDTGCNGFALDDDGFAIAFDGRLDNGEALRAKLRATGAHQDPQLDTMSDTRLLLAAYRLLGTALAEHLLGDFAIAIWDPARRQAYLVRDPIGVKPLFYRVVYGNLLFASEIKALIAMRPDVPVVRRPEAMSAFVEGEFDESDRELTFFEGVYRLLPGHFAVASRGGIETRCYWRLDPGLPEARDEIGPRLRVLFQQAISRRIRGTSAAGSLLSGGFDSSSIVSVMAAGRATGGQEVNAFSLIFSDPDIEDERDYIAAVVDKYDVAHRKVDCSPVSGLAHADEILAEQDQPPPGPNGGVFRYFLNQVMKDFDGRIILHGHGGDEVISDGSGLFGELAASGHWPRLWRELQAVSHVAGAAGPHFRRLVWRRGIRRRIGKVLQWPVRLFGKGGHIVRDPIRTAPDGKERPVEQAAHLRKLASPIFANALEIIDIEAAFAGVELRMPFLDIDLIEFCVTAEANEKWKDGLPRFLIRNAMEGLLSEKIRLRTDKHDFATHLRKSMLRDDCDVIDEAILKRADRILAYCNLAEIRADWSDFRTTGNLENHALMRLWRVVMLSRWLENDIPADDELLEAAQ